MIQIQLRGAAFIFRKPGGCSSIGRQLPEMMKITSLDRGNFKQLALLEMEIPLVSQVYLEYGMSSFLQIEAGGGEGGSSRVWKTCQRQVGGRI